MKKESNKNWTTCLRLNTGDGSPRVFLLNSHFLGSFPLLSFCVFFNVKEAIQNRFLIQNSLLFVNVFLTFYNLKVTSRGYFVDNKVNN